MKQLALALASVSIAQMSHNSRCLLLFCQRNLDIEVLDKLQQLSAVLYGAVQCPTHLLYAAETAAACEFYNAVVKNSYILGNLHNMSHSCRAYTSPYGLALNHAVEKTPFVVDSTQCNKANRRLYEELRPKQINQSH